MKKSGLFLNDRLRVSLTTSCNFKCSYCSNEGQPHDVNIFIDTTFLNEFFDKILSEDIYVKKINLTGGEPVLHKDLLQIASKAAEVCKNVTLNTNGSLLTEQLVDDLVNAGVNCIKFGVDNPFESFSKPVTNHAQVDSEQLRKIILYTLERIPRSSLNIVITKYNISELINIIEWIVKNRIDKVEFIELINFNFIDHVPFLDRDIYDFNDLICGLSEHFSDIEYNESLAKYIAYHPSGLIIQFAEDFCKNGVCANLWTRVDAAGNFSPCLKSQDTYPINLGDSLVKQLMAQKKLCCNSLTNYIPRDANGNIVDDPQNVIRGKGKRLTAKLTSLDL